MHADRRRKGPFSFENTARAQRITSGINTDTFDRHFLTDTRALRPVVVVGDNLAHFLDYHDACAYAYIKGDECLRQANALGSSLAI